MSSVVQPDFDNSGSDDDTSPPALFGLSPPLVSTVPAHQSFASNEYVNVCPQLVLLVHID